MISDRFPLPEKSGADIRTMNLARYFASLGPIDIAYLSNLHSGSVHAEGAEEDFEKDDIFSGKYRLQKLEYPSSLRGRFGISVRGFPYPVREYSKASMEKLFSLIESGGYDYVLVRYLRNTGGFFGLSQIAKRKVIIDIDDVLTHSLYDTLFAPTNNALRMLFRTINKVLLAYYQTRCVTVFGACLVCSEKDKSDLWGERASESTFVVPNTLGTRAPGELRMESGFNRRHVLLFIGALHYQPNVSGLLWFLESVYPRYRNVYPDAVLLVVGRCPLPEVIEVCDRTQGVELHPDVPDVIKYYRDCRAVIVPLLEGSGTRLKVLEAALLDRPIISTKKGVEGLDVVSGVHFLEFDDGPSFCEAYRTLSDEATYDALVTRAENVVLEKYSHSTLSTSMSKVVSYIDFKSSEFSSLFSRSHAPAG
ncbi:glycosyltransferase family 4 protein [Bradyrhizobium arachidis]|uniref:glycosyltransferase n=1 Tax=Bradyrhizobium arachidis TaxID=858423 RepID=UPI00216190D4|nr:glycosyltransferase family 4 protein [Bradyrhizobium arachidis]UVO30854.1 glycosyltransferase family 4 protein [Bradyrhizobium arachidis]